MDQTEQKRTEETHAEQERDERIRNFQTECKRRGHVVLVGNYAILLYHCVTRWCIEVDNPVTGQNCAGSADTLGGAVSLALSIAREMQDEADEWEGQND